MEEIKINSKIDQVWFDDPKHGNSECITNSWIIIFK